MTASTTLSAGDRSATSAGVAEPAPGPRTLELEIVIPALNEEVRIGRTLTELGQYLALLPLSCGLAVVDNGSADATADIVRRANTAAVPVRLIGCRRRGKGAAVKDGVLSSSARWVGFCDADLATPVTAIANVLERLSAGASVVIGSRRIQGASYTRAQPLVRRAGGWTFRRLARPLTGRLADTQCGFKFFERAVAQDLFGEVTSTGFAFDVELLAMAHRRGLAVAEVPVEWSDQTGSTLRPWEHGPQILRDLHALRRVHADTLRDGGLQAGAQRERAAA